MTLQKITIKNRSYGKLSGVKIYLTSELFRRLSRVKSRSGTAIDSLRSGRAVRGMKHLIAMIKKANSNSKIVFTSRKSRKDGLDYYIDYDMYIKHGQDIFFTFYRSTGFEVAQTFLGKIFPRQFAVKKGELTTRETRKVESNLRTVLRNLSSKIKNKKILLEETTQMLRETREEKRQLRRGITRKIEGLVELQRQSNISYYTEKLQEFERRLGKKFPETKGKNSWQKWIYNNAWLFGIYYHEPIDRVKIGFDSIPDFLFPTLDGFLDILEIKKDSFDVIKKDSSHVGSFMWSPETNQAIGQVVNYITEMELNQLQLKERINHVYGTMYRSSIHTIKPRSFILIGTSTAWSDKEREAFRKLNYSLHGIEVLTYTDLYKRGEKIISMYTEKSLK